MHARLTPRSAFPLTAFVLLAACGPADGAGGSGGPAASAGANGGASGGGSASAGGNTSGGGAFGGGGASGGGMSVSSGGSSAVGGGGAAGGGEPPGIAMDECGLATGFAGDDRCILPPPPEEGFQVHVGPTDYDDPEQLYIMQPGDEATTDFPVVSANDVDRLFYYRQYRLRPSAHHMIITVEGEAGVPALGPGLGRRIATANLSQDFPSGGVIAKENQGVGSPIAAHSSLNVSLHAINTTDQPQLREIWVNFWYRDPAEVTEPAIPWFKMGSVTFAVQPHQETVLGPYTCDVQSEGRLLWLYGHRHANNVRFTASRVRGAQRDVIYEGFHWEEPMLLEYSSVVQNQPSNPDPMVKQEGGWSGILDLLPGDKIQWECQIVNQHDTALRFTNETYLGEMCIIDAEAVGTTCSGL